MMRKEPFTKPFKDVNLDHLIPGTVGSHTVESFMVTPEDMAAQWGSIFRTGRGCIPGEYVRLIRDEGDEKVCVMSNTPCEVNDFQTFYDLAQGHILIAGLGLGICLSAILEREDVKNVLIIEKSWEVIELVGLNFNDPRIHIIQDDIFNIRLSLIRAYLEDKGVKRFDLTWFDIWDYITVDNLAQMVSLFTRFYDLTTWAGCWSMDVTLEYQVTEADEGDINVTNARRWMREYARKSLQL